MVCCLDGEDVACGARLLSTQLGSARLGGAALCATQQPQPGGSPAGRPLAGWLRQLSWVTSARGPGQVGVAEAHRELEWLTSVPGEAPQWMQWLFTAAVLDPHCTTEGTIAVCS